MAQMGFLHFMKGDDIYFIYVCVCVRDHGRMLIFILQKP